MIDVKVEEVNGNGNIQNEIIYNLFCLFKNEEVMVVIKEKDIGYDLSFLFGEENQVIEGLKTI